MYYKNRVKRFLDITFLQHSGKNQDVKVKLSTQNAPEDVQYEEHQRFRNSATSDVGKNDNCNRFAISCLEAL